MIEGLDKTIGIRSTSHLPARHLVSGKNSRGFDRKGQKRILTRWIKLEVSLRIAENLMAPNHRKTCDNHRPALGGRGKHQDISRYVVKLMFGNGKEKASLNYRSKLVINF